MRPRRWRGLAKATWLARGTRIKSTGALPRCVSEVYHSWLCEIGQRKSSLALADGQDSPHWACYCCACSVLLQSVQARMPM
jgi:hypothetical protein